MRYTHQAVKIEVKMKTIYYPIAMGLRNKRVLVVGGGPVAERKIKTLLKFGARVHVISPSATAAIKRLSKRRNVLWVDRVVRSSDIKGIDIVIAATSDGSVNKKVSRWAREKSILVNVVDDPELSDFISPAVFRASKSVVAVYTHGKDPVLSRDLKNFLKEHWDEFLSYRNRS